MTNVLYDLKNRFQGSVSELTMYLPLINLMCIMSSENNNRNNFALFADAVKNINQTKLNYFGEKHSIYAIVEDAQLYLNAEELPRFYNYARKSFQLQMDNLKSSLNNLYKISLFEQEAIEKTPIGYVNILKNIFFSNYDSGNFFLPMAGVIPNKNFAIELSIGIELMFKEFESKIDKIIEPEHMNNKNSDVVDIPPNKFEIDKIRLLHETGIIEFLQSKYPTTNANQISKFFEFVTEKPMISKNNNSSFTTDETNSHYPMNNLSITKKEKIKNRMTAYGFI